MAAAPEQLRSEPVRHAIELLAHMGASREDTVDDLVTELKRSLLALVPSLGREKLTALLAECFAFLPVEELRPVPVAVLEALARVGEIPTPYLLRLATRADLIAHLPLPIQRLVWAKDSMKEAWDTVPEAERPAAGVGAAFGLELGRLLRAYVHCDAVAVAARQLGPGPNKPPQPAGRRAAQSELNKIADTVADSAELYGVTMEAVERGWREAVEGGGEGAAAAWCALRSELALLLIADRKQPSLAKCDPVFPLALCLDHAAREAEVKKGPRETELKELLPWALRGAAPSEAERMVLGSPFALPILQRTALNRLRDAVDGPLRAEQAAAALADPGADPLLRFYSTLLAAALDDPANKAAVGDLLSGLGALGVLALHDSTGLARRAKRQQMLEAQHKKARAVGSAAPPSTLPPLPPLGDHNAIAVALSTERLRGRLVWRRMLLFYALQRVDRRDLNPTPPASAALLQGALLAAERLQLPEAEDGRWCTALADRVGSLHRRSALPQAVRLATFNGYFCDAVSRQLPPAAHASYVRLLGGLLASPDGAAGGAPSASLKAQEALPLVGTAVAAAKARGWLGAAGETAQPEQPAAKRQRLGAGAGAAGAAGEVRAAYAALAEALPSLGQAAAPLFGMLRGVGIG